MSSFYYSIKPPSIKPIKILSAFLIGSGLAMAAQAQSVPSSEIKATRGVFSCKVVAEKPRVEVDGARAVYFPLSISCQGGKVKSRKGSLFTYFDGLLRVGNAIDLSNDLNVYYGVKCKDRPLLPKAAWVGIIDYEYEIEGSNGYTYTISGRVANLDWNKCRLL